MGFKPGSDPKLCVCALFSVLSCLSGWEGNGEKRLLLWKAFRRGQCWFGGEKERLQAAGGVGDVEVQTAGVTWQV